MNLLIIGAGQHGRVAKEIAELTGKFDKIAFLDDNASDSIAKLSDYEKYVEEYPYAFVAFGSCSFRKEWIEKVEAAGFELTTIIHPSASISPSAVIESGVIIEGNAVVNTASVVKKGCILSISALVDHDSIVNECCHVETGAVVMPNSEVPEGVALEPNTVFNEM